MSNELKPQIIDLSNKLKGFMKVENEGIEVAKDAFEKTLPDDLPVEMVKKTLNHLTDTTAAFTLAAGEMAEDMCKADKSVSDVSAKLKILNHGSVVSDYSRHSTRPTSITDRTPVDVYGGVKTRVKLNAQKNSGELSKVRSTLAERGAALFGKK